ncbi:uncharacterized protein L201_007643 [Kwoniella dendrophila CBS 6074]|uniref:Uncharacterized protein n=1 Tax=Kwoniella dendrophila CBS 6074 TaxID=1295534 RepID=A0AAX4K5L8_9TREE
MSRLTQLPTPLLRKEHSSSPSTPPIPPSPPKAQETIQMMSREDVFVKLLEDQQEQATKELEDGIRNIDEDGKLEAKQKQSEHAFNIDQLNQTESNTNEDNRRICKDDQEDEDHIDGLLSPTEEMSMLKEQDESFTNHPDTNHLISLSNVTDNDSNLPTPHISDDKQVIFPSTLSESDRPTIPHEHNGEPLTRPTKTSKSAQTIKPKTTIQRYPIPNRRPKGWIASLNHPRAVSNLDNDKDIHLTGARSSSTSDLPNPKPHEITLRPKERQPSVHIHRQPVKQGRKISGTMQYAFQQQRLENQDQENISQPQHNVNDNDRPSDEIIDTVAIEEGSSVIEHTSEMVDNLEESGEQGEIGTIDELTAEEEARIRYEIGLSQDQDEVWMSYVRNQLSTLFPDFFGMNPIELSTSSSYQYPSQTLTQAQEYRSDPGPGPDYMSAETPNQSEYLDMEERQEVPDQEEQHGDNVGLTTNGNIASNSSRMINNDELSSPPPSSIGRYPITDLFSPLSPPALNSTPHNHNFVDRSFSMTSTTASTDISSLPTPPLRSNAQMLRGNVVIPSIRDEMSDLREEIERLRSVVGDLAQDLGVNRQEPARSQLSEPEHQQQNEGGNQVAEGNVGQSIEGEASENDGHLVNGDELLKMDNERNESKDTNAERKGNPHAEPEVSEEPSIQASEAFMTTANLSANIIRLLDQQMHNIKLTEEQKEEPKYRSDTEIFDKSNLEKIMDCVKNGIIVKV